MRMCNSHVLRMAERAEASTERLVKKPNSKSIVWNYFGLKAGENNLPLPKEEERPICRTCRKAVSAKSGNTSNMLTHLRDHHPNLYAEAVPQSSCTRYQPTLQQIVDKSKKYDEKSSRAQELNRAVAYYIAKDMQSLYTVEKPGFRHLIQMLDPKYTLPSRKYFAKQEIPRLYLEVMQMVKAKLGAAKYFAATSDLWTSCSNHPYLSYTAHFIDSNWQLQSFCLNTVPLFEDHTGQNITEALEDILDNWELSPENLVATTTDNGSNFVAGFAALDWTRISCFGHNLNLAINKSLNIDHVQRAIRQCHTLVELFNRSWKKNQDLLQKQTDLGVKQHKLISVSWINFLSMYRNHPYFVAKFNLMYVHVYMQHAGCSN